ncbi:hypothetical protein PTKU64_94420 (plasmid) [Paraburkholderia terrae]|uniref:Uncharacterized protein n=1 Tax=Paraburkholderia terrae TaxID=311230 RepID=A0ABM7U3J2_9BURK|nr:hypothetical protein PTKU64_94420 [Paraburkholderia terrae]
MVGTTTAERSITAASCGADRGAIDVPTRLSSYHRTNHAASLALAKNLRKNGSAHARMMELAKVSRLFLEQRRKIGE